jgi:hypothetical protein
VHERCPVFCERTTPRRADPRRIPLLAIPPQRGRYLVAGLIERHDRRRFEIFGYSYGFDDGSPMRPRIAPAFDRFVDIASVSDSDAGRLIQGDGIDILVDLDGFAGMSGLRSQPVGRRRSRSTTLDENPPSRPRLRVRRLRPGRNRRFSQA